MKSTRINKKFFEDSFSDDDSIDDYDFELYGIKSKEIKPQIENLPPIEYKVPQAIPVDNKDIKLNEEKILLKEPQIKLILYREEITLLKNFIEEGNGDYKFSNGWNLLIYACYHSLYPVVQYLLEKGFSPNEHCNKFTPLMACCSSCCSSETDLERNLKIANLLLQHNSIIDAQNQFGRTALQFCIKNKNYVIANLLINSGANSCIKDATKLSPFVYAAKSGSIEMVQLMAEKLSPVSDFIEEWTLALEATKNDSMMQNLLRDYIEGNLDVRLVEMEKQKLLAKLKSVSISNGENDEIAFSERDELSSFLISIGMEHRIENFRNKKIDFYNLCRMNEKVLQFKVGLTSSESKMLKTASEETMINGLDRSSVFCGTASEMSPLDIAISMANAYSHLKFLRVCFERVSDRMNSLEPVAANTINRILLENSILLKNEISLLTLHSGEYIKRVQSRCSQSSIRGKSSKLAKMRHHSSNFYNFSSILGTVVIIVSVTKIFQYFR